MYASFSSLVSKTHSSSPFQSVANSDAICKALYLCPADISCLSHLCNEWINWWFGVVSFSAEEAVTTLYLFVKNAFEGFPSPARSLRSLSIFTFIKSSLFFANHVWNRKPFSPSHLFQTSFSVCRLHALNSSKSSESIQPSLNLVPCSCPNMSAIMHFLLGSYIACPLVYLNVYCYLFCVLKQT